MFTCWLPSISVGRLDATSSHDAIVAALHVVGSGVVDVTVGWVSASSTGVASILAESVCPAVVHLAAIVDLNTSIGEGVRDWWRDALCSVSSVMISG